LARLALAQAPKSHDWYGPQLLFHLNSGVRSDECMADCTLEQRLSIVGLLHHILETRAQLVDDWSCADDLLNAIEYWSHGSGAATPG
jgi:hypothetical protein